LARLFTRANKDSITVGLVSSFNFIHTTGTFSLAMWLAFSDHTVADYQTIWANNSSGTVNGAEFLWRNDDGLKRFECYISKTGGAIINGSRTGNNAITDNNWHHLVITGNGTNLYYIIDGTEQTGTLTMGTKGTGDGAAAYLLGKTPPSPFYYGYGGKIAEVIVTDYRMTATEAALVMKYGIRALHAFPKCYMPMWGVGSNEPDLAGLGQATVSGASASAGIPSGFYGIPYVLPRRTAHRSIQYYHIAGVSRDSGGNILGSCTVQLFKASDKSYVTQVTSDASTGAFDFTNLPDNTTEYFIRALKDGTPNVFGITDDNLTGDVQS
jgi:hypothetical protein